MNTSGKAMHCQYYVAFFDKAGALIGCAGQGTFDEKGLAAGESTQLGSCLIPLPAGFHERRFSTRSPSTSQSKRLVRINPVVTTARRRKSGSRHIPIARPRAVKAPLGLKGRPDLDPMVRRQPAARRHSSQPGTAPGPHGRNWTESLEPGEYSFGRAITPRRFIERVFRNHSPARPSYCSLRSIRWIATCPRNIGISSPCPGTESKRHSRKARRWNVQERRETGRSCFWRRPQSRGSRN